jgi:hypothetical protein
MGGIQLARLGCKRAACMRRLFEQKGAGHEKLDGAKGGEARPARIDICLNSIHRCGYGAGPLAPTEAAAPPVAVPAAGAAAAV